MGERYQKQAAVRNFFGIKYPALLEEWDCQKNTKPPEFYSVSSNLRVHWKCRFGHEFLMGINHRTTRGQGCPECNLFGTSRNELRVYCEIKSQFNNHPKIHKIDAPIIQLSATLIRQGIKNNKNVAPMLSVETWKYIDEMNFYRK